MDGMIEHEAIVSFVKDGRATLAVNTGGCSSCGHSSGCGLGKLAKGNASSSTTMVVDAPEGLMAGEHVTLQLPSEHMTYTVLLGYLMPALGLLIGSGVAMEIYQTDGAAALGAIVGFLFTLFIARLAVPFVSRLMPAPRVVPSSNISNLSPMELHHER